jgi:hypothetical protein
MNLYPEFYVLIVTLGCIGAGLGSVWGFSIWISKQFNILRDLIYTKIDQLEDTIMKKLEYHERHDDTRFDNLQKDMFELKLRSIEKMSKINELTKQLESKD